ncbi:LuxR C-terminal-related transcriptional regulator [Massilia sp. PAMC28688]|uniref:LuxR C-terminal-related transcriptional regulator n=1 Tax=Massilia sp. PAMC28688 TaxID=2861283 RepID=UPI001C626211|nr:LuxR C-terminal-related transcriptional regulator [Massilia sp. PAMC28688]QYF94003.1 LuxR C-terminal-related transcriptional regulator [Massilia sp. PAMC28688]
MSQPVILSPLEQEYLLRIIESAVQVADVHQFFLWSQGQLQALLPHQLLVCMQFGPGQALQRLECLHGTVIDDAALARLCNPHTGLAVALARHCSAAGALPCLADLHDAAPAPAILALHQQLAACGFDNVLIDGSGELAGGATVFALFGLPMRPGPRHAYFLTLLLPHLHLALARLAQGAPVTARREAGQAILRPLSARESEVLHWLRAGKRNEEIACLLGLSALTVKNHLHRIYQVLGVRNRTEAVARCTALRLFSEGQ